MALSGVFLRTISLTKHIILKSKIRGSLIVHWISDLDCSIRSEVGLWKSFDALNRTNFLDSLDVLALADTIELYSSLAAIASFTTVVQVPAFTVGVSLLSFFVANFVNSLLTIRVPIFLLV